MLLLTVLVLALFGQYLGDVLRSSSLLICSALYKSTASTLWDTFLKLQEYSSGGVVVLNCQTPMIHILSCHPLMFLAPFSNYSWAADGGHAAKCYGYEIH